MPTARPHELSYQGMTLPEFLSALQAKTRRDRMRWTVISGQYVRSADGHCFLSYLRDDVPSMVRPSTAARIATAGDGNGEASLRARLMRVVGLEASEDLSTKSQPCPDCPGTPGRRWLGEMPFRCVSCNGTGIQSIGWASAYDAHGYPIKALTRAH